MEISNVDSINLTGYIEINTDNIDNLKFLLEVHLIEILESNKSKSISNSTIFNYLNHRVYIELRTGNVNCYFENFDDFISGNKFKTQNKSFYIADLDYYTEENVSNTSITHYNSNIQLIDFLTSLSNTSSKVGDKLKLIIYRASNNYLEVNINYHKENLHLFSNLDNIDLFKDEILDEIKGCDKKEIFLNELVNFANNDSDNYLNVVENWNNIISNYKKSYSLYLDGFSFEKIKTASNEHFQKLVDRIYDSISKVSSYIFGIPVGFILLLNYYDYSGKLIFKNTVLVFLSVLFFILIWFILIKNAEESISAIEEEIDDFISKIETTNVLNQIKEKLSNLKVKTLKKQGLKLKIAKGVTISIFLVTILVFIFIFIDVSIFLM